MSPLRVKYGELQPQMNTDGHRFQGGVIVPSAIVGAPAVLESTLSHQRRIRSRHEVVIRTVISVGNAREL